MKTPSAFLKPILLLAALLLGACGDTGGEEPPPNGEPKETFPCEGPWCFDPENNPLAKEAWDYYQNLIESEFFETITEIYAACSYDEVESGVVAVRCPEWVDQGFARCPNNWFKIAALSGEARPRSTDDNTLYCFPETDHTKATQNRFFCADGYVNPGYATPSFDMLTAGTGSGAACLRPEDCATLEALAWPSKEKSCFYPDFSHISEGVPETIECDTLAEGECSINCACPELPSEMQSLYTASCHHLSPHQPVGVCGFTACIDDSICALPDTLDGRCLNVATMPEWAEQYQADLEEKIERTPAWGVCVQDEHFANWRNNDDPAYRYGDE